MSTTLQALEKLLLSQERREQSRVQETLSMMQLAQSAAAQRQQTKIARRQVEMAEQKQNIAVMGSNLELLQKSNDTMKLRSAENFLQQSGLSAVYSKYKDKEDGLNDAVDELVESKFFDEDIQMDKQIANDLISATWSAYEQQNPNAIINIGSKLHYLDETDKLVSSYDKKLYSSFEKLGILRKGEKESNRNVLNQFKTMRKSLDNEMKLTEEVTEFARGGDKAYTIDREFDIIDESLRKIELEKPDPLPKDPQISSFDTILPPDKLLEQFGSQEEQLNSKRNKILEGIDLIKDNAKGVERYRELGLDIPEKELNAYRNTEDALNDLSEDLKILDDQLKELSTITKKAKAITFREETLKPMKEIEKKFGTRRPGFGF